MFRIIAALLAGLGSLIGMQTFQSPSHRALVAAVTAPAPRSVQSPRHRAVVTAAKAATPQPAKAPVSAARVPRRAPVRTPKHPTAIPNPPTYLARPSCPESRPGFGYSFWNPYDNWSAAQVASELARQQSVKENGLIVDWAVDQEANAAWYPNTLGYSYFEDTLPTVVSAAHSAGMPLWMGLIVSPNLFADNGNDWSFLEAELPKFEAVADDLYQQYGSEITGWYVPTEPTQSNFATYALSVQYGQWLGQLTAYLHTHDGNKQVMIAAEMPSASLTGVTPTQYAQELAPAMAVAGIDVWNVEDGFDMTGWTPAEEAAGFTVLQQEAAANHTAVWADVYTGSNSTPAQFEPYLQAIAATGTHQLSQWTFPDYMDPDNTAANPSAASEFSQYAAYCAG